MVCGQCAPSISTLWDTVKQKCCRSNPNTIELKENIQKGVSFLFQGHKYGNVNFFMKVSGMCVGQLREFSASAVIWLFYLQSVLAQGILVLLVA